MATDPEGKKLYTASSDGFIRFWDIKTGKPTLSFEAHKGAILSMFVNHRLMYTAGVDGTSKCWVTEHGDNTLIYKGTVFENHLKSLKHHLLIKEKSVLLR